MRKNQCLLLLSSFLTIASCNPISYQKIKFVVGPESEHAHNFRTKSTKLPALNRNSRSFNYPFYYPQFWPIEETIFLPPSNLGFLDVSIERGHVSPDFSNGLDYPDPLLLTGKDAYIAVKYLYGKGELFYHQIPHIRALLRNQEERRQNGLAGHYLSSNRPGSPFFRN